MDQELSIYAFLIPSCMIFALGMATVLIRRNAIVILMGVEVMLLSANINFIGAAWASASIKGEIFIIFSLTIAAAEVAVGFALIMCLYRYKGTLDVRKMNLLKG